MATTTDLDHIALAFHHAWDGFDRYGGDLGGQLLGGGPDPGFSWHQLRFANGMKVELLEPHAVEQDDFLARFLERNGPGPHHMTFKVPDILTAIEHAKGAGCEPTRVNLEHAEWKEAFLHPKSAHGIVVQLAQTPGTSHPPVAGIPSPRAPAPASLDRITHLVADLERARGLWEGVLDGRVVSEGSDAIGEHCELIWPGGGRIRLVRPSGADDRGRAALDWLGDRAGRLHHLELTTAAVIDDAVARDDGSLVVAPEANFGTRLHLRAPQ